MFVTTAWTDGNATTGSGSLLTSTDATEFGWSSLDYSRTTDVILYVLFCLEAVIIIVFNVATVATIIVYPPLRSAVTNTLIIYLSIADCMNGPLLLYITLYLALSFSVNPRLHAFFANGTLSVSVRYSVCTLTLIAIDRLIAIWKPLSYSRLMTFRRAHVMVAVTWTYITIVTGVTFAIGVLNSEPADLLTSHPGDFLPSALYLGLLIPHIYIPIALNCLLYVGIFVLMSRQARRLTTRTGATAELAEVKKRLHNRRIARMMSLVLGGMIVAWLPFTILIQLYRPNERDAPAWWGIGYIVSLFLQFANSFVNPLIYCWQSGDWRAGYRKLFAVSRGAGAGAGKDFRVSVSVHSVRSSRLRRASPTEDGEGEEEEGA